MSLNTLSGYRLQVKWLVGFLLELFLKESPASFWGQFLFGKRVKDNDLWFFIEPFIEPSVMKEDNEKKI